MFNFEYFDRLEVVNLKNFFSCFLFCSYSLHSIVLLVSVVTLETWKCLASGFQGILELVMLLKQHICSPFKAGSINFAQVTDFCLDIFADMV